MARRRRDIPDNIIRPLSVGVFVIMVVTVVVLQLLMRSGEWGVFEPHRQPEDLNTLLNDYLPDEETVLAALQPSLPEEAMQSADIQFTGRNSLQTTAYVSKPEGAGPFPAIILVHDAPASQRSAQRLSSTVGERLSREHSAVVISVDWQEGAAAQNDLSDVVSAVDWIERLQENRGERVYVLGIGYGGYLSFLAADEINANGVISIGGYHDPETVFNAIEEEHDDKKDAVSERGQQFLTSMGCDTSASATACLEQLSAEDALRSDMPVLIVHNQDDAVVPASQVDVLTTLLGENAQTEILSIDSDQHDTVASTTTPGFEETMTAIHEWLNDQLNTAQAQTTVEVVVPDAPEAKEDDAADTTEREPIVIEVDPTTLLENATEQDDS